MRKKDFLVPFGLDDAGRLVPPGGASRDTQYRCPACRTLLVFRAGELKRAHFAHAAHTACDPEGLLHLTAKLLIVQVVQDWKAGSGPPPLVVRACGRCKKEQHDPLPARIELAVPEYTVDGGWRVDVALMAGERIIAAVEVFATHKVGEEKARSLGVPCAELRADEILESPFRWRPVSTTARPLTCSACIAEQEQLRQAMEVEREQQRRYVEEAARRLQVRLAGPPYIPGFTECYRCSRETVVYDWRGRELWERRTPPHPRPQTIRFKFSKTVGHKYWANVCMHCGAIQGDFFLYCSGESPFVEMDEAQASASAGISTRR